jgi:hypothetical protein
MMDNYVYIQVKMKLQIAAKVLHPAILDDVAQYHHPSEYFDGCIVA